MGPAPINSRKKQGNWAYSTIPSRSYFTPVIAGFWAYLVGKTGGFWKTPLKSSVFEALLARYRSIVKNKKLWQRFSRLTLSFWWGSLSYSHMVWYIYLHEWLIFSIVNGGKPVYIYITSPMDLMGNGVVFWRTPDKNNFKNARNATKVQTPSDRFFLV